MRKNLFGFTLAEVLITLGIIGVVAALTIPTLMTNYKKKQYYTQFMKARSALENAIRLYEDEHGQAFESSVDILSKDENIRDFMSYFAGSQPVTLDNYQDLLSGYDKLRIAWYDNSDREDGSEIATGGSSRVYTPGFITNDGMLYVFNVDLNLGNGGFVDTNGPNAGPNTFGRDMFVFYLVDDTIRNKTCNNIWGQNSQCEPLVGENERDCYADNEGGSNCAARLIERGKMDY